MEVVMKTGTIRQERNHHHQQTNTQQLDALPVADPTVSKH